MSDPVAAIVERAREQERDVLLDTESLEIVRTLGIAVPEYVFVAGSGDARERWDDFDLPGDRVVVKVVSPEIPHKTDVGGIAVVPRVARAVLETLAALERRFADRPIAGFTLSRFVEHDAGPAGELLLGLRWTDDFGPVVTLGPGGVYTEFLSSQLAGAGQVTVLSPRLAEPRRIRSLVATNALIPLLAGGLRGRRPRLPLDDLVALLGAWLGFADQAASLGIRELEVNPLALTDEGPVALDALCRLGPVPVWPDARPIGKLRYLLQPRSAAIVGVSRRLNPGRVILGNMIREGFRRDRLFIIKPGCDTIDGCRCVPDLESLPRRVDLLVLAIDAEQVPATVARTIELRKAESLIVIPGGLGEREGTDLLVRRMRAALDSARASAWEGPLINGGNCLGVRSRPGRYDTLFIPEYKLPRARADGARLALICQSGAFAVARLSKLADLAPRYLITVGNQFDLTVGDYLTYLKEETELDLFACYVEGFRPLDGVRWLAAAEELRREGRTVVLYRAGRTAAGARASVSHTASVAGNYTVTRELARAAGVVVAENLEDFEDLTRTFCALADKRADGWRLGALSNAGFECVAIADAKGRFELPAFGAATTRKLGALLERCGLDRIVDVRNPFDVTPIMDDAAFEAATRAVLEDDGVDVAIVGCVPLTGALNTLAAGAGHAEDLLRPDSVVSRLARLRDASDTPFVAVVDAGPRYDPMVRALWSRRVPTFRTADRALRVLETFCRRRLPALEGGIEVPGGGPNDPNGD